ncbi:MAG: M24 family metallopeptidase [Gammaproteobacteria bacterium]|nr:M24 family metallopeptidase [Gammaproteobacteria bacterium]
MSTAKEYARRRQDLMRQIGDGIAVIPSAPISTRNGDVHYRYRADSDFFYLTGFNEPEAVAVLAPGRKGGEFLMFCRERDAAQEMWDGDRAGLDGAVSHFKADDAFPIEDMEDILPNLLENRSKVYCNLGRYPDFDKELLNWVNDTRTRKRSGITVPGELVDLGYFLHECRLIKRAPELKIMRKAAAISTEAHRRAMVQCKPGLFEYEIEAELEYAFRKGGAQYPAYPSIVAAGANACVLHYIQNSDRLRKGDLLLIDAGAEIDCYCADITRTFPVSGKFSGRQRAIYDIVLEAQLAAIDRVKPGADFNAPHEAAVRTIAAGLKDLKFLKGSLDSIIERGSYRKFFVHRTSHWLGMDVHDVGEYRVNGAWRMLEPGMVLTIEPGIYIPAKRGYPKEWQGIGIRIEDDVLVTRNAPEVLTDEAPKAPEAIEALMASMH